MDTKQPVEIETIEIYLTPSDLGPEATDVNVDEYAFVLEEEMMEAFPAAIVKIHRAAGFDRVNGDSEIPLAIGVVAYRAWTRWLEGA